MQAHRPRKRFGQNFLRDAVAIADILDAIAAKPDQHMVEIGPGQGALTLELLKHSRRLDVIEIDRDLVETLKAQLGHAPNFHVHSADALAFPFCSLVEDDEKLRIVGNLPYNISTPLLFHLFEQKACIADMHFMLQKEVVERLAAAPGDDAYGRLSVMAQYHCHVEILFDVYPESFYPPPKVVSSVFRLIPHAAPPVAMARPELLEKVVAQAFSQRRKTLRNTLKGLLDEAAIVAAGVDPTARAETLSLADFAALVEQVAALEAMPLP